MNSIARKVPAKRKRRIGFRLRTIQWADQPRPMLSGSNIHHEVADKTRVVGCGGIGERRMEESYLDGLGAQRIPRPSKVGDFCRRFTEPTITQLTETINRVRLGI